MAIDAYLDHVIPIAACIPGWRSMHRGWQLQHAWMAINASRDGDRSIPEWRSMHPWVAIDTPRDGVAASLDGDRCIPGWWSSIPGVYHCIPGWRSMHLGLASQVGDRCTREGDQSISVGDQGWRSMHPGKVIDASGGGDRYTTGWRRSLPGWRSMHPGMASGIAIDASRCQRRE